MCHLSTKFCENRLSSFCVILITNNYRRKLYVFAFVCLSISRITLLKELSTNVDEFFFEVVRRGSLTSNSCRFGGDPDHYADPGFLTKFLPLRKRRQLREFCGISCFVGICGLRLLIVQSTSFIAPRWQFLHFVEIMHPIRARLWS